MKMRCRNLFQSILVLLFSVLISSSQVPNTLDVKSSIESYAVYSALLNEHYCKGRENCTYVVFASTNSHSRSPYSLERDLQNDKVPLNKNQKTVISDYKVQNKTPEKLTDSFEIKQKI